jgi:superfamily II DNA/RNA helicase
MSAITIKPNNHRIYQVPNNKKIELINKIIDENSSENIVVVCANAPQELQTKLADQSIRVVEDRELVKDKDLRTDFLISYDMPIEAIVYIERVGRANEKAVMLLDEQEQKLLYKIEMLLGRAIKQEKIEGFEYPQKVKRELGKPVRKKLTKEEISEIAKKRYEKSTQEKPKFDKEKSERDEARKPKKEFKKDDKKDNKWAKKKPAPKMTGKKIAIKARKIKED